MPTNADQPDALVDTSFAVALSLEGHEAHQSAERAAGDRRLGLAGHAAFETFSVLTRLPPPRRRSPDATARLLRQNFPMTRFLSEEGSAEAFSLVLAGGIAGGAVYDALVGAAAKEHGCVLLTRDRRALTVYRLVGADVELIS